MLVRAERAPDRRGVGLRQRGRQLAAGRSDHAGGGGDGGRHIDHVAMVYSIQLRSAVRRATRSKTMARGGSKIGVATKAALATREAVAERMRVAARGAREAGTSEAEAAQGAIRKEAAAAEATARAEALGPPRPKATRERSPQVPEAKPRSTSTWQGAPQGTRR